MFKTFENFGSALIVMVGNLNIGCLAIVFGIFSNANAQLGFIQNSGQWPDEVNFRLEQHNCDFWFDDAGWTVAIMNEKQMSVATKALHGDTGSTIVSAHVLKVKFDSPNKAVTCGGKEKVQAYHNYFLGSDKSKWKRHVPIYKRFSYSEIYSGIDLDVTLTGSYPKMTYVVKPGASHEQIQLHYLGNRGLMADGNELKIKTSVGDIIETGLRAFQLINGREIKVDCAFEARDGVVSFVLGNYDKSKIVFIDPTIVASTNSGGTGEAFGHSATFSPHGQIYSAGRAYGGGYPTDTGSFQMNFAGPFSGTQPQYYLRQDACLSKYNQDGSELIYATYIGGNGQDLPHSLIATDDDYIYIFGTTNSTNFPTTPTAFDTTYNGSMDIFILALNEDGSQLIGSTYLGGSDYDGAYGNGLTEKDTNRLFYADEFRGEIILDSQNNVYVASYSKSTNFPSSTGAYQTSNAGYIDGVLVKLNESLSSLIFSTYLGGTSYDAAYCLKLDDSLNIYVGGFAKSTNFPMTGNGAFNTYQGGLSDGFLAKFNPSATQLLATSFFGTSNRDRNYLLDIGSDGGIYIYGATYGTISASAGRYAGPADGGYIYRTNTQLSAIEWVSTFGQMAPAAFLVDNCNRIYVSGQGGTNYVLDLNSFDTVDAVNNQGHAGFYLMRLSPNAEAVEFGSFYGEDHSHVDGGTSRFDKKGVVYQDVCSNDNSSGVFPTTSWAYSTSNQSTTGGKYDNCVFKIDFGVNQALANVLPGDSACAPFNAIFSNQGSTFGISFWDFGDGFTSTDSMPQHTYENPGTYQVYYVLEDTSGCYLSDTASLTLTVTEPVIPQILIGDTLCVTSVMLSVDSSFTSALWSTGDTGLTVQVNNAGIYSVTTTASLYCQNSDTIQVNLIPAFIFSLPQDTNICEFGFEILGPDSAFSYLWSTGDTTIGTKVQSTGQYILTASDGNCEWIDTIEVNLSYIRFSSDDTVICRDSLVLTYDGTPGTVLWSNGSNDTTITVYNDGIYWVKVTNGICINSDTIRVDFYPELVNLGPDTTVCRGIFLNVPPGQSNPIWSSGDTAQTVFFDSSAVIWLQVNNGECMDRDSIYLIVENLNFSLNELVSCNTDTVNLFAPTGNGAVYHWSTGSISPFITVTAPGQYWVSVQTDHCAGSDSINIRFVHAPKLALGGDTVMCIGETLALPLDSGYSNILWSDGSTNKTITLQDSGIVWVNVSYDGCFFSDTIQVSLRNLNLDHFAMISNVITPNEDGLNDKLKLSIEDEQLIKAYNLKVYNRWGVLVFESNRVTNYWDGKLPSGEPADAGTYYYLLKCETVCHERKIIEIEDNVTVIK